MPEQDGIDVKGPMGISAKIKGASQSGALLLVMLAALFLYIARNGETKADDRHYEQKAVIRELIDSNQALIYMMALPPEERAELLRKMQKPRMIRELSNGDANR